MNNLLAISVTALNRLLDKPFYDLTASLEVMNRLLDAGLVDGFELQHIGEWDGREPPREDGGRRVTGWRESARYSVDELAERLHGLPITTIHANRDVGICLCSDVPADKERGKTLMHESLQLAQKVGARVSVYHLWDTWLPQFDPTFLREVVLEIAPQYPDVQIAIENVPTHLPGYTPFELVKSYEWLTLDLRWSALYDEFFRYEVLAGQLANVHLSAVVGDNGRFALHSSWFPEGHTLFTFDEAVQTIGEQWQFAGPLTVELNQLPDKGWPGLVAALKNFKR